LRTVAARWNPHYFTAVERTWCAIEPSAKSAALGWLLTSYCALVSEKRDYYYNKAMRPAAAAYSVIVCYLQWFCGRAQCFDAGGVEARGRARNATAVCLGGSATGMMVCEAVGDGNMFAFTALGASEITSGSVADSEQGFSPVLE